MGDLFDESLDADEPVFEPEPDSSRPAPSAVNDGERLKLAVRVLRQMHESLGHVISVLEGANADEATAHVSRLILSRRELSGAAKAGSRTVEGAFDGLQMLGSDGKAYPVPPNYASKSRLVEGDMLKLTIRPDGTFVFKQIAPVERKRVVGCVAFDSSTGEPVVVCGETTYKVLPASVTFYKADAGAEAVVLVPNGRQAVWAAVENIVSK
ncbi:hypothetical protein EBS80_02420 [bacterium]|nr:hypothetical protein [bacterium]